MFNFLCSEKITEFSLAPLFTLVWLTVKTTQCMIICYDLLLTIRKQCAKNWFIPTNMQSPRITTPYQDYFNWPETVLDWLT